MPGMRELKHLIGEEAVRRVARAVAQQYPPFDRKRFERDMLAALPRLELMDRARAIAAHLHATLRLDFREAIQVLLRALEAEGGEPGFHNAGYLHYVGKYGLGEPEASLEALGRMTVHFSGEFDIRPFLLQHTALALAYVHRWARHPDWRVRRLASEGTRPRLPWGVRLTNFVADPRPVLEILELLKDDPDENVRRSVANNLNDISKDHPEAALEAARRWLDGAPDERRGLVRHALRTLTRQGNAAAIGLLGFDHHAEVRLSGLRVAPSRVPIGGEIRFSFTLTAPDKAPAAVAVDYAVHYLRSRGERYRKVFRLAKRKLAPGERAQFEKRHALRPLSVRRLYPGKHALEVLVNGKSLGRRAFTLEEAERG
jgi:3-methyladenine DNA glycosylase AlkC